jgi:hypothetical protein
MCGRGAGTTLIAICTPVGKHDTGTARSENRDRHLQVISPIRGMNQADTSALHWDPLGQRCRGSDAFGFLFWIANRRCCGASGNCNSWLRLHGGGRQLVQRWTAAHDQRSPRCITSRQRILAVERRPSGTSATSNRDIINTVLLVFVCR